MELKKKRDELLNKIEALSRERVMLERQLEAIKGQMNRYYGRLDMVEEMLQERERAEKKKEEKREVRRKSGSHVKN